MVRPWFDLIVLYADKFVATSRISFCFSMHKEVRLASENASRNLLHSPSLMPSRGCSVYRRVLARRWLLDTRVSSVLIVSLHSPAKFFVFTKAFVLFCFVKSCSYCIVFYPIAWCTPRCGVLWRSLLRSASRTASRNVPVDTSFHTNPYSGACGRRRLCLIGICSFITLPRLRFAFRHENLIDCSTFQRGCMCLPREITCEQVMANILTKFVLKTPLERTKTLHHRTSD